MYLYRSILQRSDYINKLFEKNRKLIPLEVMFENVEGIKTDEIISEV